MFALADGAPIRVKIPNGCLPADIHQFTLPGGVTIAAGEGTQGARLGERTATWSQRVGGASSADVDKAAVHASLPGCAVLVHVGRTRTLLAVAAAVLVLVVGVIAYRWWHNRPPYGPEILHATATLEVLVPTDKQKVHRLGVGDVELLADPGDQMVRGRVTWTSPPAHSDGWFALLLIDKRSQRKPPLIFGAAANGEPVSSGSDGVLNRVAERYPWLRGAGDIRVGEDNWRSGGMSLSAEPDAADVSFLALFPAPDRQDPNLSYYATAPIDLDDLLLALVFIGPDRQVYWAQPLL